MRPVSKVGNSPTRRPSFAKHCSAAWRAALTLTWFLDATTMWTVCAAAGTDGTEATGLGELGSIADGLVETKYWCRFQGSSRALKRGKLLPEPRPDAHLSCSDCSALLCAVCGSMSSAFKRCESAQIWKAGCDCTGCEPSESTLNRSPPQVQISRTDTIARVYSSVLCSS